MKICGLIVAAGLAAGANAGIVDLDVMVSTDGVTWSSSIDVLPGTSVHVGLFAVFSEASFYGVGTAQFRISGGGGAAGDAADFEAGRTDARTDLLDFGASGRGILFGSLADGSFRVDNSSDAANSATSSVNAAQANPPSNPFFDFGSPTKVAEFVVNVGADATARTIAMIADQLRGATPVAMYATSTSTTSVRIAAADVGIHGGAINVVPTPASLALIGLGGLVAGRRRR
jgi:hypothetical protein